MADAVARPAAALVAPALRPWLVVWSLAKREWVRFVRQRNRVLGAIGQPVIFWLFFGEGLSPTFRVASAEGLDFREYFFPGTLALILLFTAIFTTISVIEDRREGFLQSVLIAPVPRWAMVLGKLLGGTAIALAQGVLFLLLGLTLGLGFTFAGVAAAVGFAFFMALSLTGLGFVLAWKMDSTQGFHAVMSVILFPLWLLSGAFFPAPPGWLGWLMMANPLTYEVAGLRHLLYFGSGQGKLPADLPSLGTCLAVTAVFTATLLAASCAVARQRTKGDLL
jgi:ABC-2 type transport system permease protein